MMPAILLTLWASYTVKSSFNKYSGIPSGKGYTGYQAAREILDRNGLKHIKIELTGGFLSDHYDPGAKILRLSEKVARVPSLAAVGVAAHEAGHALQQAKSYSPLLIRQTIAPISQYSTYLSYIFIIVGAIINAFVLTKIGIIIFSVAVFFSLFTLPVEFNASKRARHMLLAYGIISKKEDSHVKKVLDAAAMTYVAAAMSAVLTLLYYIIGFGSDD